MRKPQEYKSDIHKAIINDLIESGSEYTYNGLYRTIMKSAKKNHIKMGINKAKQFSKYYYNSLKVVQRMDRGVYLIKPY